MIWPVRKMGFAVSLLALLCSFLALGEPNSPYDSVIHRYTWLIMATAAVVFFCIARNSPKSPSR